MLCLYQAPPPFGKVLAWAGFIRALVYLDDGIVAVAGKEPAEQASKQIREDLANAGLIENTAKCNWEPTLNLK